MKWSEQFIARALAQQVFNRKYLVVVPNCTWTGHECDILAVTENLRVIDVEIKVSRADLKADAAKDKWVAPRRLVFGDAPARGQRVDWPRRVWKHYYAVPGTIWRDDLAECLGSPASGVLTLEQDADRLQIRVARRAFPNRDAERLSPASAVDIARLASLRMWDAYAPLERAEATS